MLFTDVGSLQVFSHDSKTHSCHKNIYISFATEKKTQYGQIKIFYTNSDVEKLAEEQYKVLETVKCNSDGLPSLIQSYVCVEKTDKLFLISDCDIGEKCIFFKNEKKYFVPLFPCFEHD